MIVQILRDKTPAERLAQAYNMWDFAVSLMTASIRNDFPNWTAEQIQQEINKRIRGRANA